MMGVLGVLSWIEAHLLGAWNFDGMTMGREGLHGETENAIRCCGEAVGFCEMLWDPEQELDKVPGLGR